jgi:outer membrane protein TolC
MKSIHLYLAAAITTAALLPEGIGLNAQEIPPELTVSRAIERALETDIRLPPKRNALQLAQLRQNEPVRWDDPELRFETGFDLSRKYLNTALRVYPPNPWENEADQLKRESLSSIARADCLLTEAQVAAESLRLYREIQCLEKEIELAARLTAVKKEMASIADRQVAASVITSGGVLRFHWELRDAQQTERELRRACQTKQNQLAIRTGLPTEKFRLTPLDLNESFAPVDPEALIEAARSEQPNLHLLEAQLQLTGSQLKNVQAAEIPWFNYVQTGYSENSDAWDIQVAISIPVFSRQRVVKFQILTEQALRQAAITTSEKAIAVQIRDAVKTLDGTINELTTYRTERMDLDDETRAEINKLQQFAPSAPMDWIQLQEWIIKAESRQLQLLRNVYSAQADLFALTGATSLAQTPQAESTSEKKNKARE